MMNDHFWGRSLADVSAASSMTRRACSALEGSLSSPAVILNRSVSERRIEILKDDRCADTEGSAKGMTPPFS